MSAGYYERMIQETAELHWVARELERLAPAAPTPPGGTSHDGRRAFQRAAARLRGNAEILRTHKRDA